MQNLAQPSPKTTDTIVIVQYTFSLLLSPSQKDRDK